MPKLSPNSTGLVGKSYHNAGKEKPRLLAEPGSLNYLLVVPSAIDRLVLGQALALVLVLREQVRLVALEQVLEQRRQAH